MKCKGFSSIPKIDIYSGWLPLAVPLLSDLVLIMAVILKLSTMELCTQSWWLKTF